MSHVIHGRRRPSGSRIFGFSAGPLSLTLTPVLITRSLAYFALSLAAAAILSIAGGIRIDRHPDEGIVLFWTAFGIALALALVGVFSVGPVYLMVCIMMLMAISAGPNPTKGSWYGLKFMLPEAIAFAATLAVFVH